MTLVFRCKLAGNGASLKIYLQRANRRRDAALSFPPSLANERMNEEALTSTEGANAAIQSMRNYDAENEKQ